MSPWLMLCINSYILDCVEILNFRYSWHCSFSNNLSWWMRPVTGLIWMILHVFMICHDWVLPDQWCQVYKLNSSCGALLLVHHIIMCQHYHSTLFKPYSILLITWFGKFTHIIIFWRYNSILSFIFLRNYYRFLIVISNLTDVKLR